MPLFMQPFALALGALITFAAGARILVTNDDSWTTANIRTTYNTLKELGHDVLLVAPSNQESGHGGQITFPNVNITPPGGEFNSIPVGAPFFGHDVNDPRLWYINATPAATVIFALDVVVPMVFGNGSTIDLIVAGPNEGQNAGPSLYTVSGTIGATYAGIEKGVPGIAISAVNGTHRNISEFTGLPDDPAATAARLTGNFVTALINTTAPGAPLLPASIGISINMPLFAIGNNCTDPPFVLTRMTGGATIDKVFLDPTTGFPQTTDEVTNAVNPFFHGAKFLPGENVVSLQCMTSVSFFSVDYDAPSSVAEPLQGQMQSLFGHSSLP